MRKACIYELQNTIYLIVVSLIFHANGRKLRHVLSQPCDKASAIDVGSSTGVKIEPLSASRVYVDSLSEQFTDGHQLVFEFKTTSTNTTLFYTTRRNDEYDMVSAGITDGYVQFKIRCKTSNADLTMPKFRVDDGKWHKVAFRRKNRKGLFRVDNKAYFRPFYVDCGGFTSVTFGQPSQDDLETSYSVRELQEYGAFGGCIRNMYITTGTAAPPHYVAISECN